MLKFLILAVVIVAVAANSAPRHRYQANELRVLGKNDRGRIVGGIDSNIEDFPYQIGLFFRRSHTCGGSIVSANTILSAAHCTYDRDHNNFQVLAGQTDITEDATLIETTWLVEHPEYDDWELWNDVVILRLERDLVWSDRISAVPLPTPTLYVPDGRIAHLAGWGDLRWNAREYPDILQSVEVPVWSNARCQAIYDEEEILDQHICAGEEGRDACQGDSGGPLVYNNVQIGIVSWGYYCALEWPTVYARVSEFLPFILQHINA